MPGHSEEKYDALLPERVEARLLGLSARTAGFVILALLAFTWASLLTWSANDLSLTGAKDGATGNAGGSVGAVLSDILLQMLGFGAIVCLYAPMIWAIELIRNERVLYFRSKAALYPLSILLLAGAFATVTVVPGWPLHYAMGGILGDLAASFARAMVGNFASPPLASVITGLLLFAGGLAALAESVGADSKETVQAAWTQLRSGYDVEDWHRSMRSDRRETSSNDAPERSPALEPTFETPLAPPDRGREKLPRILQNWRDGSRPEFRDEDPVLPGPLTDVGGSDISEQFAKHFGNADETRPGSRAASVSGLDDQEDETSRSPDPARFPAVTRRPGRALASAKALMRPPLDLLKRPVHQNAAGAVSQAAIRATGQQLLDVLADYGVRGEMRDINPGPVVTLYEFEPTRGTKSARVIALADDIARSMSVLSVRAAVVPGRNAIGLELPNAKRDAVVLREMLESEAFRSSKAILPLALGKSIGGEPVITDLARMPHLLVAGTTGSGKSVGVNAMILSLLYRLSPDQCRMIMIDPKMLELSVYNGIPHLLTPVVTDPHKAVAALGWAVSEMEERYKRMAALSVRNIEAFNQRVRIAAERNETLARTVQTGFDPATGEPRFQTEVIEAKPMPYIVIVVDEFADLMIVAGKDIEQAVQRLAQMARAAGIHLIMATQRPSVDIITGTIKANFPTRISFKVTSKIDSRTILNEQGAEQLLGQGDMLFSTGAGAVTRVHGPFVSDDEVEAVARHLKSFGQPEYVDGVTDGTPEDAGAAGGPPDRPGGDDLYERAREIVLRERKVSTSYIQRRLQIGYNRAADIIDRMEREGLISSATGTGRREILKPAA